MVAKVNLLKVVLYEFGETGCRSREVEDKSHHQGCGLLFDSRKAATERRNSGVLMGRCVGFEAPNV